MLVARPKEFDRDEALRKAMHVFWERGYEAPTMEDLRHAMGIGRQSLYDTFGDKHALFLEALALYNTESGTAFRSRFDDAPSALRAIEQMLMDIPAQKGAERARGCLSITAAAELAARDGRVASAVRSLTRSREAELERAVRRAQAAGELPPDVDAAAAGRFLFSALQGLRFSAQIGASTEALRDIGRMTLRAIGAAPK